MRRASGIFPGTGGTTVWNGNDHPGPRKQQARDIKDNKDNKDIKDINDLSMADKAGGWRARSQAGFN